MNVKLTAEQRIALDNHVGPLPIEDEQTQRMFFLLDQATLNKLEREANRAAIRDGIADMEAGRVRTLEELDARIHADPTPP
jgi:predicted transcriptional regulator